MARFVRVTPSEESLLVTFFKEAALIYIEFSKFEAVNAKNTVINFSNLVEVRSNSPCTLVYIHRIKILLECH